MLDFGRLVEIKAASEGSGFLIADRLILTTWHLISQRDGQAPHPTVRVRLESDAKDNKDLQAATVLWPRDQEPGDDFDFALLTLPGPPSPVNEPLITPIRWAKLDQWGEISVTAVGYPDTAIDRARNSRDTKGLVGWIQLADNQRALAMGRGTHEIRLRDEDAPAEPAAIAWTAMSGAGVFVGSVLIGIVRTAGQERARHRLHMLPIDRLLACEDVVKIVSEAGYQIPIRVELPERAKIIEEDLRSFGSALSIRATIANAAKYCGKQNDETHEQTGALCRILKNALANPDANGPPLGLFALNFELRSQYTRGPALRNQKEALYGGIPDAPLNLTPLDFAASQLTFDRTLAADLYSKIIECSAAFSSYSILSYPGQGKSIALAQVLLRLSATPGYWTFWSFDLGTPFKCEDSSQCIERLSTLMRQSGCVPKRLIFLFDALDRRSQSDFDAIFDFHSYCEEYSKRNGVAISFLLSLSDHDRSFTDNTFRLSLDPGDENRLYEAILATEPRMAAKSYDTIDEMLRACPLNHPWKNDVQSATDYIIQNSEPIREFTPNWFSDLNDETQLARRALTAIAVSTLLDLALPDHIAHELSEPNRERAAFAWKAGALVSISRRIAYEKMIGAARSDEWPGYVLKSPYYASSLLRRLEKLDETFVSETIMRIFDCSLARAEQNMPLWKVTDAVFIRHLFHRLAKRKVNRLSGFAAGTRIAAKLFASYGDRLLRILRSEKSAAACANWAGTFSYLLIPGKARQFHGASKTTEEMIYDLCSYALKENRAVENSQVFVTLLLAIRALCDPYAGEQKIKDLAEAADQMFDLDRVLDSARGDGNAEAERRSNQVVLSYTKFLRLIPDRKLYESCRTISNVYDRAEERFLVSGFPLDALNLLERAEAVWIRSNDSVNLARRARYLREARAATRHRSQLRYRAEVERSIARFEIEYRRAIDVFE